MNTLLEVNIPLSQPDPRCLAGFVTTQNICFSLAGGIAGVVLIAWLFPLVGEMLPGNWSLMKANTALAILLSIASLILTQAKYGKASFRLGTLCGVLVLILAATALFSHLAGRPVWLDTLLAADSAAEMPGRMSVQTAGYFLLLGFILVFPHRQQQNNYLPDTVNSILIVVVLVIFSGYLFDALHLFGHSLETRTSPHTLTCMILLLTATITGRLYSNYFSIFTGIGIGSHIARISIPWSFILPFVIIGVSVYSMRQE